MAKSDVQKPIRPDKIKRINKLEPKTPMKSSKILKSGSRVNFFDHCSIKFIKVV